jgi:hypothetical protein
MGNKRIIEIEVTEPEAIALAQLCKRVGYSDLSSLSTDEQQTHMMLCGLSCLSSALDDNGLSVS